ncbi:MULTISPECIES: hypothetical protein [Streptomyces]|uniref:Uncharacterized protein n=2 Tax=Streptomyces TaxID=1883 RepID=A0A2U9P1H7_STRAS|nr:hypothetical protein [Streptomyces actuosus]AWT43114.1 hypothetical protein DMT42_12815 [Streptomyces actuosus]MBM4824739.1 hypothetical protein [Streptomyces actuosus]
MKKALVGLVAAGVLLTATGTAVAAWGAPMKDMKSGGVLFLNGRYKFNPADTNHGAFEWQGDLKDDDHHDGHNVYMQARVEGHGWVRYNGKQNRTVSMHHSNWDGAQRYTDTAYLRACRDRGSLRPDNCSVTQNFGQDD